MASAEEPETYAFSADISQLMSLIINAFYSNKEIFLRELISNASDAMDKIQYKATQDSEALASNPEMYIKVQPDREARTITVEDSGVGMTRDELVNNLGTIAKSGTKAFMEAVQAGVDMSMIGQFGVGFYSAYLVSERIRVVSKSNQDEQHIWESTAGGTFTVWKDETLEHGVLKRGTKIICYLKDDQSEFLESDRLRDLILKHSAFVGFPIELLMEHRKEEDGPEGSEEKVVTVTHRWELINKNKPVWLRPAEDVTHEEYADLYKWLAGDWEDHLAVKHVMQSGQVEYKALLYCPRNPPKDIFDMGKMAQRFSIRLYVRRVFIKEFNDLIPKWMGFIKGIVDSDDMPLNISREQLQQNAILKHIKAGLQKSAFQMFNELARDKERYRIFYESFAQCLKLGVYEDHANREQIKGLLRYHTSKSGQDLVSLEEYVARMKPGQRHILYIFGRSLRDAAKSPYIEGLKKDGYEILYMFDPVDEYATQFLKEFQGTELMSCTSVDASRLLESGRSKEDVLKELEPLRRRLQVALDGQVARVGFGEGLSSESVGRVVDADDGSKVLELNHKHGLIRELGNRPANGVDADLAMLILEAARVDSAEPDDSRRAAACERFQEMIQQLSMGDEDGCADEIPNPEGETSVTRIDWGMSSQKAPMEASAPLSCGSAVRVLKEDRARRAIVSFVDEDAKTLDVMYPLWGGGQDEEEGVPAKKVQRLMPFEDTGASIAAEPAGSVYQVASAYKEEGNQLFKIKDFEAAHEKYSMMVAKFCGGQRSRGQQVLVRSAAGTKAELQRATVTSVDAGGECELSNGTEVAAASTIPVFHELLPLQTAAHMNRARCRQNLALHKEAAQDLTVVLGLWDAADRRMLEADPEMKDAEAKGLYTAHYLRAKSRLARKLAKQAAADVKAGLAREPPATMAKQLRQLKAEVQAAQEEHRRVHGPLVKELAKVVIALRGLPQIS
mmetsp:Transcript_70871/g.196891  ORF Transcript_70871/g.196891 Transcript_70871/m.196891 type:complete len:959 (-) Transcript_70871:39-2915(-)